MKPWLNKKFLVAMIFAGGCFWLPDIAVHAMFPDPNALWRSRIDLTVLLPLLCLGWFFWYRKRWTGSAAQLAGMALLGIWILGPMATTIMMNLDHLKGTQILSFNTLGAFTFCLLVATLTFPISTPLGAGYVGTLYALMIVTALCCLGMATLKKKAISNE